MASPAPGRTRALNHGSARSMLMVILSEYLLDYPAGVAQRSLVAAMQTLGHSPESTRQALSRAVRAGALVQTGRGTAAVVNLSDDARAPLTEARARLDDAPHGEPAEDWLLVLVRAKDTESAAAYSRRTTLLLNGLGSLGGGVWLRPRTGHAREIVAMLVEDPTLDVVAMTARIEYPELPAVVAKAWDSEAILAGYDELLARFGDREPTGDEDAFRAWTEFVEVWQRVAKLDPELPEAALGENSARPAARALVERRTAEWRPAARAYFRHLTE